VHHPLDRPVWNALTTRQAYLAQGDARALRIDPDHGPFGAPADHMPENLVALAGLVPAGGELWCVDAASTPPPPGTQIARSAVLTQMVAPSISAIRPAVDALVLTDADAPEMQALAHLTRPGPFLGSTHRLGRFIGIRDAHGMLVAMAGERMRLDGFTEVSGVCTHPDHRGRGLAAALIHQVASAMLDRGETPFLHSYADNAAAISLYEALGFRARAAMNLAILVRTADTPG